MRDGNPLDARTTAMTRAKWQRLAQERLLDAKALLQAKRWTGAYYLAGYAVECGLKSCIIAFLMKTDQFPERRFSEQCWTHDLERLLGLAGLEAVLDTDMAANSSLQDSWEVVKAWSESKRYDRIVRAKALELYDAIAQKKHGVLPWIKNHW
jgi:HEPN domain-containing protein